MSEYEFSTSESKRISNMTTQMRLFGILNIILAAVILFGEYDSLSTNNVSIVARLLNALVSLILGIVLLRPVDNLKRIVQTSGSDITELMTALKELLGGFKMMLGLVVVYIVVLVVELILIFAG